MSASDKNYMSWPWWRWSMMGLSVLAFILSTYLSWHYLAGESMIGCGGGTPCDEVLSSRWSTVGGILPISGLAMGTYLTMLLAICFIGTATEEQVRQLAWESLLIIAGAIAGSAVWFTILQVWFIGTFCPYCMTTHIIGLLLTGFVLWFAPRQCKSVTGADNRKKSSSVSTDSPTSKQRLMSRVSVIALPMVGFMLAAIMVACQISITPATVSIDGELQGSLPVIDPYDAPLVGSPDAPHIVTLLFDYECSHCQQMHFMLDEVVRRYDGKLAFVLCPTPLNSHCNPYISRDVDEFKDSCELTKIALAVWVSDQEAFHVFDRWMFSMESGDFWKPRNLDVARNKAVELIGKDNFEAASNDPWIDMYLQTTTRIYGETGNGVPKLVYDRQWIAPMPYDADGLVMILQDELGVPKP